MQSIIGGRTAASGRDRETAELLEALGEDGPRVTFVHGIAGVGKSTLLALFATAAQAAGSTVIRLDGREMEPTDRGFLGELGRALGVAASADAINTRLAELADRVVIVLDTYEVLRLLDTWIRSMAPSVLPANTRLVLGGRVEPATPWFAEERFRALALGPLAPHDAEEVLMRAGMPADEATRINRVVRGYPLGLAIAATTRDLDLDIAEAAVQRVTDELTRTYLADVEPLTRQAIDAACST